MKRLRRMISAVDVVEALGVWALLAVSVGLVLEVGVGIALIVHGALVLAFVVLAEVASARQAQGDQPKGR